MAEAWRKGWIFAVGLLAGVLIAGWLFPELFSRKAPVTDADAPPQQTSTPAAAPSPGAPAADQQAAAPAPPAVPTVQPVSCTFQPLLAQAGADDGKFRLQDGVPANRAAQPSAYLTVAREAAEQGRSRDAEVALITACRVAGYLSGPTSADVADAQLRLAQHYAAAARAAGDPPPQQLVRRAEALLSESLRAYTASLGKGHAKTRLAAQALEAVSRGDMDEVAQAGSLGTLGAARGSAQKDADAGDAASTGRSVPSFDCAKARSAPEKMICSDPELAQLDRDLGRLHAQARSVTRDPAGFDRRNDQAWTRRESTCRDKACLLQWYASRKSQLLSEFGTAQR